MKILITLPLLFSLTTSANTSKDILISNLWKNIGHTTTLRKIEKKVEPTKKELPKKELPKKEEIKEKKTPPAKNKKTLSKGQLKIEEMKRKNRERLKQSQNNSSTSNSTKKSDSIYDMAQRGKDDLYKQRNQTYSNWKKQEKETLEKWKVARDKFLSNIKQYKENTFELESSHVSYKSKKWDTTLSSPPKSDYHVVRGALALPIKDQGKRPTCSAFAGTRAIEIALFQKGRNIDLSEQYIYWASKPYCQTSPCSKRGSWISFAYDASKSSSSLNIPRESACPYVPYPVAGNETQLPIDSSCRQGVVKINSYKKLNSTQDLIRSLNNNQPVVAGFKLSPNFYKTKGIITYKDSLINGRMDEHASGHAVLIIGHMKVPKKYKSEGKSCFIIANSWSEGWATGGHGCITQKWLTKYRVPNPFLAITKIKE
jgi:C1A family cysteine protease